MIQKVKIPRKSIRFEEQWRQGRKGAGNIIQEKTETTQEERETGRELVNGWKIKRL